MCVKREVFDKIGYFDEESFPYGYGEENDLCIRASEEGYRLNIAVDAFVFHSKSKSYSDERRRKSLMNAGNIKLRDLHGTERVDRLVQSMQQNPTLAKMRDRSLALY
jgi:GT2 family glycosyltransferase